MTSNSLNGFTTTTIYAPWLKEIKLTFLWNRYPSLLDENILPRISKNSFVKIFSGRPKEDISLDENDVTRWVTSFSSNEMSSFGFPDKFFAKWKSTFKYFDGWNRSNTGSFQSVDSNSINEFTTRIYAPFLKGIKRVLWEYRWKHDNIWFKRPHSLQSSKNFIAVWVILKLTWRLNVMTYRKIL